MVSRLVPSSSEFACLGTAIDFKVFGLLGYRVFEEFRSEGGILDEDDFAFLLHSETAVQKFV